MFTDLFGDFEIHVVDMLREKIEKIVLGMFSVVNTQYDVRKNKKGICLE